MFFIGTGKTLCLLCGALAWQRAVVYGKTPNPSKPTCDASDSLCNEKDETLSTLLDEQSPQSAVIRLGDTQFYRKENSESDFLNTPR